MAYNYRLPNINAALGCAQLEQLPAFVDAKRRLFDLLPKEAPSVINLDDPRGSALAESVRHPVTYSITRPANRTLPSSAGGR